MASLGGSSLGVTSGTSLDERIAKAKAAIARSQTLLDKSAATHASPLKSSPPGSYRTSAASILADPAGRASFGHGSGIGAPSSSLMGRRSAISSRASSPTSPTLSRFTTRTSINGGLTGPSGSYRLSPGNTRTTSLSSDVSAKIAHAKDVIRRSQAVLDSARPESAEAPPPAVESSVNGSADRGLEAPLPSDLAFGRASSLAGSDWSAGGASGGALELKDLMPATTTGRSGATGVTDLDIDRHVALSRQMIERSNRVLGRRRKDDYVARLPAYNRPHTAGARTPPRRHVGYEARRPRSILKRSRTHARSSGGKRVSFNLPSARRRGGSRSPPAYRSFVPRTAASARAAAILGRVSPPTSTRASAVSVSPPLTTAAAALAGARRPMSSAARSRLPAAATLTPTLSGLSNRTRSRPYSAPSSALGAAGARAYRSRSRSPPTTAAAAAHLRTGTTRSGAGGRGYTPSTYGSYIAGGGTTGLSDRLRAKYNL